MSDVKNAVSSGNIPVLDEAIRNGFDVVNYVEQDNGLIHLASYHGQLQVLQRLLTQGIFVWQCLICRMQGKSVRS